MWLESSQNRGSSTGQWPRVGRPSSGTHSALTPSTQADSAGATRRRWGEHEQETRYESDSRIEMAHESLVKEATMEEELNFVALLSLYSNIR